MMTRDEMRILEHHTATAHSRDRYTDAGWAQIIRRLSTEGFNTVEAEWVLRSKHMRWAADHANRNHSVTAANFAAYVIVPNGARDWACLLAAARKEITPKTPTRDGAYLAGACEGEQIAALIDFARRVRREGRIANQADLVEHAGRILDEIERRAQ